METNNQLTPREQLIAILQLAYSGELAAAYVVEYETAARFALACGREDLIDCLLTMAEVEWEHEKYFRSCVLRHRWSKRITIWPEPPSKEAIRASFERTNEDLPRKGAKAQS